MTNKREAQREVIRTWKVVRDRVNPPPSDLSKVQMHGEYDFEALLDALEQVQP